MSDKRPLIRFDHHSKEFANNRTQILENLRTTTPLAYTESHGGYWVITSYEMANIVLERPEIFSSEKRPDGTGGVTIPSVGPRLLPAEADAPLHTQLRKSLMAAYSPKALKAMDAVVREIVAETIDRVLAKDEFDIVEDIAEVVPALVGLRHLGFPEEHRATMVQAIKIALKTGVAGEKAAAAFQSACGQMMMFAQERRRNPTDDVMSALTQWKDPELSDEELMWFGITLFVGGFKNPGAHITNMMIHLAQDTALRSRLIADRSLIPKATVEFLRFYSSGVSIARNLTRDFELGGIQLQKGERVLIVLPGVNHDEAVFENAGRFDIDRSTRNRHMAFGGGPHFCVGFKLAGMMFERLLNEIFDRMPHYTVDIKNAVRVEDAGIQAGYEVAPATTGRPRAVAA